MKSNNPILEKMSPEFYANFNKLIEVLKTEETIDFTSVDNERSECIEYLSKKLKDKEGVILVDIDVVTGKSVKTVYDFLTSNGIKVKAR